MTTKLIYLDHAAATPLDKKVLAAMEPYLVERFYNPSASYLSAKAVAKDIEAARSRVAHWLGARSSEIIFTAGGTEANNLAINGILEQFPGASIVVSAIEHPSVAEPARAYGHIFAPVDAEGVVDLAKLEQVIKDETVLVSVMYANNEIGSIQPLRRISQLINVIREQRKASGNDRPLYFHTDACQAAGYLNLHVSRLGVDLMTINAGKIYGPKQCGALYVKSSVKLQPQIKGGGQERGLRSGTENAAGVVGLAAALDMAQEHRNTETHRLRKLQLLFMELLKNGISDATINGTVRKRLPNNIHVTIPGIKNERLIMELDERGIQCAAGSACSAAKEEASQVLAAIGLEESPARSSLRFTMGRSTNEDDVRTAINVLTELVNVLRR